MPPACSTRGKRQNFATAPVHGLHGGHEAPDHSAPKRLPKAPLMGSERMQRLAIYQAIAPRIASLCSVLLLGGLP